MEWMMERWWMIREMDGRMSNEVKRFKQSQIEMSQMFNHFCDKNKVTYLK